MGNSKGLAARLTAGLILLAAANAPASAQPAVAQGPVPIALPGEWRRGIRRSAIHPDSDGFWCPPAEPEISTSSTRPRGKDPCRSPLQSQDLSVGAQRGRRRPMPDED